MNAVEKPRNPWRDVVHIDIASPGKHGARPWMLKLSCGHLAFRSRGDTVKDPTLRAIRTIVRRRLDFAPKRVRCLICGLNDGKPDLRLVK